MKKRSKEAPQYSMGSDMIFLLKNGWRTVPKLYPWYGLLSLCEVAVPAIGMVLPSRVISLLESGAGFERLVVEILLFSMAALLCGAGVAGIAQYADCRFLILPRQQLGILANLKIIATDYPHGEDQKFLDTAGKRGDVLNSNNSSGEDCYRVMRRLLTALIGLFFFGAVLWSFSPLVLLGVAVLTCLSFLARRQANRWVFQNRENWAKLDRKMNYVNEEAGNYRFAKDVRLFGLSRWLEDLYDSFSNARRSWGFRQSRVEFAADAADCAVAFLREGAAYAVLLWGAVKGEIDPAAFVLYFSAVGNFSDQLLSCLKEFSTLHKYHLQIAAFRELLEYPESFRREGGRPLPKTDTWELELKNVSFRYPGAKHDTIHNMNLVLRTGEKTALVGLNGAGKTTLVKLLCGLYDPTEGQVLLNGIPVTEFNREEYYTLFSAVFQESAVRPYSVARNISMDSAPNREKVERCLKLAGLWEKVENFPRGVEQKLMKYIWHDGVDLSGGEAQKLMLARALYKDGPVILLDEPTAALDPIAEAELYEKYGELTAGKTSLYISHRLSSTRFCDRVLFLENGAIAEEGTHESLLEQRGKYFELYEIQSAYYRQQSAGEGLEGGAGA